MEKSKKRGASQGTLPKKKGVLDLKDNVVLLFLEACAKSQVSNGKWKKMSDDDKNALEAVEYARLEGVEDGGAQELQVFRGGQAALESMAREGAESGSGGASSESSSSGSGEEEEERERRKRKRKKEEKKKKPRKEKEEREQKESDFYAPWDQKNITDDQAALLEYKHREDLERLVDKEAEYTRVGVDSYTAPYKVRGWKARRRLEVMVMKGHLKINSTASGDKVKKWARKWIKEVLEEVQVQQLHGLMEDRYGGARADVIKATLRSENDVHPDIRRMLKAVDKKWNA
jgi:hypothetical protein